MKKTLATMAGVGLLAAGGGVGVNKYIESRDRARKAKIPEAVAITVDTQSQAIRVLTDLTKEDPIFSTKVKTVYDYVKNKKGGRWLFKTLDGTTCLMIAKDVQGNDLENSGLRVTILASDKSAKNTAIDFEVDGKPDWTNGSNKGGMVYEGAYDPKLRMNPFPGQDYKAVIERTVDFIEKNKGE